VRKYKPLQRIFTAIPPRYDLINSIMTLGMDRGWRRGAIRECLRSNPGKVLDLCCGTGDLLAGLVRRAGGDVEFVGIDYSPPMLEIASKKLAPLAGAGKVSLVCGDAAAMPFPDGCFDCVGISFAFRNLTYKNPMAQRHLAEVLRVLKDGGRFVIVETSQPKWKLIRKLNHLFLRWFAFRIGAWLSGDRDAYFYLTDSASRFYAPDEVRALLLGAGFQAVTYRPLFFGAAGIYVAVK